MDLTALCKKDFGLFCECILGQPAYRIHREWIDLIQTSPHHLLIVAAREHRKSTFFSQNYPIWAAWSHPPATSIHDEDFTLIESSRLEQSGQNMRKIQMLVQNNEILARDLVPTDPDTPWNNSMIVFKNGNGIMCGPFGPSTRGKHPNRVICDDILADENTNAEQAKNKFFGQVWPIGQTKKCKKIIVGTPQSFDDLFQHIKNLEEENKKQGKPKIWGVHEYPAVVTDGAGNWLRPQIPELFTMDMLRTIRDGMPTPDWLREYMLQPVGEGSMLFPRSLIDACLKIPKPALKETDQVSYYFGGDIALSDAKSADFIVYTILGHLPGFPLWIADLQRFKGLSSDLQFQRIQQLHAQYNFSRGLIESNALARTLADLITEPGGPLANVIEPFETTSASKSEVLGGLELAMRNNNIRLLDNDELIKELSSFGLKKDPRTKNMTYEGLGAHDDCVMSLAFAVRAASRSASLGVMGVRRADTPVLGAPTPQSFLAGPGNRGICSPRGLDPSQFLRRPY